jgi:RNA polymerase sigma-70 factor, ECF subfamily
MNIHEEEKLVEKAKESLQAFDLLYDHYLPKIYSYILNRVGSQEIAEDVTSKTFLKAMTKLKSFEYRGYTFGAWLYKIAHNNIVDYYRSKKGLEVDLEKMKEVLVANKGEISKEDQIERQTILLEAISKLPENYQQMLTLRFFEELSNQELADVLGCSKNTATVGVHRASKALRKVLVKMGLENYI